MEKSKFFRKKVSLDGINIVNENDRKYYNKTYVLSVAISNAINPTFLIYAEHEQQAIDILAEYNNENELSIFSDYYDVIDSYDEEEIENLYQADNGMYTDLSYFHMEELERR